MGSRVLKPWFFVGFDLDTVKMLMSIFVSTLSSAAIAVLKRLSGHGPQWHYRVQRQVIHVFACLPAGRREPKSRAVC